MMIIRLKFSIDFSLSLSLSSILVLANFVKKKLGSLTSGPRDGQICLIYLMFNYFQVDAE